MDIRRILFLFWVLSVCFSLSASSSLEDADKVLVKRASGMSAVEITDLADSAHGAGDDHKAMALYMSVCNRRDIDPSDEEKHAFMRACLGAGDILMGRGSYSDALRMYIQGLKASDACTDQTFSPSLYKNIGNVYCRLYDYERGIAYYKKAIEMCRKYPDRLTEKKILVNMAGVNVILGNIGEAKACHRSALLIPVADNLELAFMDRYGQGKILTAERDFPKAVLCFRSLAAYADTNGLHPRYRASAYQELANAYEMAGRGDSAIFYMKKCLDTAKSNKIEHMFLAVMLAMSKHYEKGGDVRLAQECKNRYLNFRDSLLDMREFDAVKHVQFLYESEKVSDSINLLQSQKKEREATISRQRIVIMFVTGMLAVIVVSLMFIYRQKKRIDRGYRNLYAVNSRYVSMQEEMRHRHLQDVRTIEEKDREIASLRKMAESLEAPEPAEEVSGKEKYRSSNLDGGRMRILADVISRTMDEGSAFCDPDFSLDALASLVGSNTKYVSQAINDAFGKNFSSYVNEYRVNLACLRLSDSDGFGGFTIKAIGESVGFKSQSTFINVFRKMTGITPSVYQKIAEREKKGRNDS